MTLDEAIQHCKEEAEKMRKDSVKRLQVGLMHAANDCEECAAEHEQLAKWLEELLRRREDMAVQRGQSARLEESLRQARIRINDLEAEVNEQLAKRADAYERLWSAYAKIDELVRAKEGRA